MSGKPTKDSFSLFENRIYPGEIVIPIRRIEIFSSYLRQQRNTKIRILVISLIALLVMLVALPLVGYLGEADHLTIEILTLQSKITPIQGGSPRIQVLSEPPLVGIPDISSEDQSLIENVDYSNYFVVIAFFGTGSSTQDRVLNVYQFKSVVWVRSQITANSSDGGTVDHYQIVKIDKNGMPRYGKITFRLLAGFEEKARTVQTVLAISDGV